LVAGIGAGAIAIFVGGFFWAQNNTAPAAPVPIAGPVALEAGADLSSVAGLSEALLALANEARNAGVSNALAAKLDKAAEKLTADYEGLAAMAQDKSGTDALKDGMEEMQGFASSTLADFGGGLLGEAQSRGRDLARKAPWTAPGGAAPTGADERKVAAQLTQTRNALATSSGAIKEAASFDEALEASRTALKDYAGFAAANNQAARLAKVTDKTTVVAADPTVAPTANAEPAQFDPASKIKQFDAIMASSREMANKVIGMGGDKKPGSKASDAEKANWELRRDNAGRAKDYMAYLDKLSGDIRSAESAAVANDVLAQANKYKGYLVVLLSRSTAALP